MEQFLDKATKLINVKELTDSDLRALQLCVQQLELYYIDEEWRFDLKLDELGKLPKDLKRGVLSEDGIYNLLEKYNERFG